MRYLDLILHARSDQDIAWFNEIIMPTLSQHGNFTLRCAIRCCSALNITLRCSMRCCSALNWDIISASIRSVSQRKRHPLEDHQETSSRGSLFPWVTESLKTYHFHISRLRLEGALTLPVFETCAPMKINYLWMLRPKSLRTAAGKQAWARCTFWNSGGYYPVTFFTSPEQVSEVRNIKVASSTLHLEVLTPLTCPRAVQDASTKVTK